VPSPLFAPVTITVRPCWSGTSAAVHLVMSRLLAGRRRCKSRGSGKPDATRRPQHHRRAFNALKDWRELVTRFDKRATTYRRVALPLSRPRDLDKSDLH
jgi:hypothetical protein